MARIKVFDKTTQTWVYADKSFGKDGTSVTVKSVSESTEPGGSNVVTFSDGKTLTIKNGKDGYTPVPGVDYNTPADQEAIVQQVILALGTPVFGRVDEGNKITLSTEHLATGTYYLGYEDKDGNWVEIGTINHSNVPEPTYTNILDVYPVETDVRWSSSGKANSACVGMILVTVPWSAIKNKTVRFKGFPGNITASNTSSQTIWIDGSATKLDVMYWKAPDGTSIFSKNIWLSNGTYEDGDVYAYQFIEPNISGFPSDETAVVKMSLPIKENATVTHADLDKLIITIDEPIV